MPNITIYLPDDVARAVNRAAKAERLPVSRWVSALITRRLSSSPGVGLLNAAGAIPDFPSADEIRKGYGADAEREGME